MDDLKKNYKKYFESEAAHEFTVYGRVELAGNHTDHQKGQVIVATVNSSIRAVAEANGSDTVNICSEGYGLITVKLDKSHPQVKEKGTPQAIVRGMASKYPKASGFNAYISSNIPAGKGLASSAAFEVLIGKIIEELFDCKTDPTTLAVNAQYAENVYYGKPCGLMDQMACAYGGIMMINFNSVVPTVERICFDFEKNGYTLCLIDSGAGPELKKEYRAEILADLSKVSNYFFRENLSQVDKRQFASQLAELRKYAGDRAVLRAMHVLNENFRVSQMAEHLKNDRLCDYLHAVNRSGDSSWMLMQNVIPAGSVEHQDLAFAIITAKFYLADQGASRIMGTGFSGRLQAYVPNDNLAKFVINVERVLGKGSVTPVHITEY